MASFNRLFKSLYPRLLDAARRRLRDADAAEDVVQEAFVRLLDEEPREPAAWVTTVARRLAIDHHRAEQRRERKHFRAQPVEATSLGPDEWLDREQRVATVRRVLERLTPSDRQLLVLYHEGHSYKEIAKQLGVAPSSIGPLLVRAHKRFLACYQQALPGDPSPRRDASSAT